MCVRDLCVRERRRKCPSPHSEVTKLQSVPYGPCLNSHEQEESPTTTARLTCSLGVGVGVGAAGLWLALCSILSGSSSLSPVSTLPTPSTSPVQKKPNVELPPAHQSTRTTLKFKQNWGWGLGEMASASTHYLFSSQDSQVSYCIWASLLGKTGWPRPSRALYPSTRGCTWPHSAFCVCLEI